MDIYTLDPQTFLPLGIVEGYTSMIWTERFVGPGEFEFKTSRVFESLPLLPRGSFITLRDSNEVMIVETTAIDVDAEGYPELTDTGRSLEIMLEHRVLTPNVHGVSWSTYKPYTRSEICLVLLWNHLVNDTGEDPTKLNTGIMIYTKLPNVVVTESTPILANPDFWWFDAGEVYKPFQSLLVDGSFGIRSIRPNKTSGTVISFDTSRTDSRGNIIRTPVTNISELRLDIYVGTDRSIDQDTVEPVIFHFEAGHITNPKYLFSIKDYKNVGVVFSSLYSDYVFLPGTDEQVSGFDRKVVYVDAGVSDAEDPTSLNVVYQKGYTELLKHPMIRLFDGEISPATSYVYGKDYFLGDKVSLMARYGFEETMLVSEYIRTEDAEGDRGYPGLSALPA